LNSTQVGIAKKGGGAHAGCAPSESATGHCQLWPLYEVKHTVYANVKTCNDAHWHTTAHNGAIVLFCAVVCSLWTA